MALSEAQTRQKYIDSQLVEANLFSYYIRLSENKFESYTSFIPVFGLIKFSFVYGEYLVPTQTKMGW